MSMGRVCGTCRWAVEPGPELLAELAKAFPGEAMMNTCHLNPPIPLWVGDVDTWDQAYPLVRWYDFCSHWQGRNDTPKQKDPG